MRADHHVWNVPPTALALPEQEVHVWRADLLRAATKLDELTAVLSADEQEKARRFRFERDRTAYIAGRGILRTLLGRYLRRAPGDFQFECNAHGKPSLAATTGATPMRFNLSHSHGWALYAFACGAELGVDLELVRPEFALREKIAERFFSPREVTALRARPASEQPEAFFACWTRKEAYLKARGDGLFGALDQFAVEFTPGAPPAVVWSQDDPEAATRWAMHSFPVQPGFAAALVIEGQGRTVRFWNWD